MNRFLKFWPFIIITLFGLTPLLWFYGKGNVLINGIDTNFPLDPEAWFLRRFYVWNNIANAGSDFSSSTAGLFFHLIQFIPYKIGFNLQQIQIISLVFWFCLLVFGAFFLARTLFAKRSLVQLSFVCLYSFNIYLFNIWENVKVANLSLMAAIPYALVLLVLLKQRLITIRRAALFSVFLGIILSGTGINPAYFISFFVIVLFFIISEFVSNFNKQLLLPILKDFLTISIPVLLVNLFWIIPTGFFIFNNISPSGSLDGIGFTNWVDSLSENTSILNVIRLQGAWDWYPINTETNTPYYIPYASSYFYKLPFIFFSLLLPLLAFVSLLRYRTEKSHLYLAFGVMLLVGVFLGTGTHAPTGTIFRFLLDHLPFFSLFRSPWYIFTPLTILGVSGLVSLLFFDLYKAKNSNPERFQLTHLIIPILIITLIVGNLFYSYPLISGKIFRSGRSDSFYVQFPNYVLQVKDVLTNSQGGRIVSYPDSAVENFEWGYRGIETILQLLVDRETLFVPLNMPDSSVAYILKEFYLNLKKGEITAAQSLAGKLNIGLIFNKGDQTVTSYDLGPLLKNYPSFDLEKWKFYQFPDRNLTPKIFTTNSLFFSYPYKADQPFFSALKPTDLVLNPQDDVIGKIVDIEKISGKIVFAENNHVTSFLDFTNTESRLANRLFVRNLSEVIFTVELIEDQMYQPVLERYKLEDFGLDTNKGVELEIDNKKEFWSIKDKDDSFIYFHPVFLVKGKHQIKIQINNRNLVENGNFNEEIGFKKGGEGKGEGLYEIIEAKDEDATGKKGKVLGITNIDKADIAAIFNISAFDPMSDYYFEVKYKQIYGNHGQILITQWNKDQLLKVGKETMPNYPEWKVFSFYYDPVRAKSDLFIELTAPYIKDPLGTTVLFDDIKAYKVFSNKLVFINQNNNNIFSTPQVAFKKTSSTLYESEITGADKPHVVVFSENYSPFWELSLYNERGVRIPIDPLHFSANLYANAWYLEGMPANYKMRISYYPQELFLMGLRITVITIIAVVAWNIIFFIYKRRFKK